MHALAEVLKNQKRIFSGVLLVVIFKQRKGALRKPRGLRDWAGTDNRDRTLCKAASAAGDIWIPILVHTLEATSDL